MPDERVFGGYVRREPTAAEIIAMVDEAYAEGRARGFTEGCEHERADHACGLGWQGWLAVIGVSAFTALILALAAGWLLLRGVA